MSVGSILEASFIAVQIYPVWLTPTTKYGATSHILAGVRYRLIALRC